MCIVAQSESGHGGRFEPCDTYRAVDQHVQELAAENAAVRQVRDRMATALQKAVDDYGKPGGPWSVPSEPGTWIMMAKDALGGE